MIVWLKRVRLRHVLIAAVLVYGPIYAVDYWCGHCISSQPPYWPFQ